MDSHLEKINKLVSLSLIIALISLINACGPSRTYLPGAASYQDDTQLYNPSYLVYHTNNDSSKVYFSIPTSNILFVRKPADKKFVAHLNLSYKIINIEDNTSKILDVGNIEIDKEEDEIPTEDITGYFDINLKSGKYYYINFNLHDKTRKNSYEEIITVDKSDYLSKENFLIRDSLNKVKFINFISPGEKIKIHSERSKQSRYFLTKLNLDKNYPLPIFIENDSIHFSYQIDSIYSFKQDSLITLKDRGLYLISKSNKSSRGILLLSFYDNYPLISKNENLIGPIRYITSDEEFTDITNSSNKEAKSKIEMLWAKVVNELPETKKLLTTYYKRVEYSNFNFTSVKEGWKTDRGLVYVIFGPPTEIYKTPHKEVWTYGSKNSYFPVEFLFNKSNSSLSDNDYRLERSKKMKDLWQTAVETWRKGKVFDATEIMKIQEEIERQNRSRNSFWSPYYRY